MMNDPIAAFQNAMTRAGIFLAAGVQIIPDGQLHRANAADDKSGQLSIWYTLHLDVPASGAAGNWRTSARLTWCSKRMTALSATERAMLSQRIERDRRQHESEKRDCYRKASERASTIWTNSALAKPNHPYLLKKAIAPGIAHQSGPSLVLPVVDFVGVLHGLQFIDVQGGKKFLSGMSKQAHFIPVAGLPDGTRPLYVSEGFATAATLAAMKPDACHIAACDCGNLQSVAQAARAKWPGLELVICPDFDAIGQEKGKAAAIAAQAKILPPPAVVPPHCSDWNDIAAIRQGVKHGA